MVNRSSTLSNSADSSFPAPTTSRRTLAEAAVEGFIEALNRVDVPRMRQLFEVDAEVIFEDTFMSVAEYFEEMLRLYPAFPDLSFTWQSVQAMGDDDDQAILKGLRAQGTHTRPYGFGPYPEIEATHVVCKNDPEDVIVWVNPTNGKIRKAVFVPKGELTGPPGFYTQIGGLIF